MLRTLLCALLLAARPLSAQVGASGEGPRGFVAADFAITRLARGWSPQVGGSLALSVAPRVQLGGAARFALRHANVAEGGSNLELRFGYGGLLVTLLPAPATVPGLRLALLAGGGNVDVRDPVAGTVVDADNGVVLEPTVGWRTRWGPAVAGVASLSWRVALGFEAPGGISSRDLSAPSLSLGFSLGPF